MKTTKERTEEETKVLTVTELDLKILLLQKKRDGRDLERAEPNILCCAIWRKRKALKREKLFTKIKESAATTESSKENKEAFHPELDFDTRGSREGSRTLLARPLLSPCRPSGPCPIREGRTWKNLRVCCGSLVSSKKLEKVLSRPTYGEGTRTAGGCAGHELSEGMSVFHCSVGTKSCGCHELCRIQADRSIVCDEQIIGLNCGVSDVTPVGALHSASKRQKEKNKKKKKSDKLRE